MIAFFITPHGFGHAGRVTALMQQLQQRQPSLPLHVFTQVPERFFRDSLSLPIHYHDCLCDLGLVQRSSLEPDLAESARRLAGFIPFDPAQVTALADTLKRQKIKLVICDIAPLGLAAAEQAGIDSVLLENFTWDWIYQPFIEQHPAFAPLCEAFEQAFTRARYHVQLSPVCQARASADYRVAPVARQGRLSAERVRAEWPLSADKPTVLITMGGVSEPAPFIERLRNHRSVQFILTGVGQNSLSDNVWALTNQTPLYTPDLINACDALVAKTGYSTLAEAWCCGIPLACVTRKTFRESWPLQRFVEQQLGGLAFDEQQYRQGDWLAGLDQLLAQPRRPAGENGAAALAEYCLSVLPS